MENNNLNFDDFKQHKERHKCKCCGGDIIYDNTNIGPKGKIKGKSYLTTKEVNNIPYKLQVCQKCLLKKYPDIKNLNRTFNVMSEVTKFAFDIPDDIFKESRSKYAMTESHMIEKYGEEEGRKKWNEYCEIQAKTNTYEYKKEKYGWTKEQFDNYNQSRAVTIENLISRYGEEEGRKRWDKYVNKQRETKSKEYMISKFGYNGWKYICKCKGLNIENFTRKYGELEGFKRFSNYVENTHLCYSFISQDLFSKIDKYIGHKYTTYYATKNNEFSAITKSGKSYKLDYYIKELNICVEFNGNVWHANPKLYGPDEHYNPFDKTLIARDKWNEDETRIKTLENDLNIKTYVVWESEYDKNFDVEKFITDTLKIPL